jgi:translation initiation factor 5A
MAWIDAYNVKVGTGIILDGVPCATKSIDISKSGKHGASKCRIEAVGILDGKKRIVAVPGAERFETPMIEKRKGQILSVNKDQKIASVMDLETFETTDIPISEDALADIEENKNAEYWVVSGKTIIKRIINN